MNGKKLLSILVVLCLMCAAVPSFADGALRYGIRGMTGDFNPFTLAAGADRQVVDMVTLRLLDFDRNGELSDASAAEVAVMNDGDMVRATVTLKQNIFFSDGTQADIDDVIFALYVLLDSSYSGNAQLKNLPILGLTEYRIGMTDEEYAELISRAESLYGAGYDVSTPDAARYWVDALEAGGRDFAESLTAHYCAKHPEVSGRLGGSMPAAGMYLLGYADLNAAGQLESLSGRKWTLADGDAPGYADLWQEMKSAFQLNAMDMDGLHVMSEYLAVGDGLFDFVNRAYAALSAGGETAAYVSGIVKSGAFSVDLLLTSDPGDALIAALAEVPVVPVAHYGDEAMGEIGFPKGDLSGVWAMAAYPMGAGAYALTAYENGEAAFVANANYCLGVPKTASVRFIETSESDALMKIVTGELDAVLLSLTEELERMICSLNVDTKALTGNCIACYDAGGGSVLVASSVRTAGFAESYAPDYGWIRDAHLIEIR